MPIRAIHADETCPLEGYENLRVRVLLNASEAEMATWHAGHLGIPNCEQCAKAQKPPRGRRSKLPAQAAPAQPTFCPACQAARDRFGRALVTFYGPGSADLDFSSEAAALATMASEDLPAEILMWLMLLPRVVRARRLDELEKNLFGSLTTPTPSAS